MNCSSANNGVKPFPSQKIYTNLFNLKKSFFIIVLTVLTFSVKAQFTYLETGITYDRTVYKIDYTGSTIHNNLKWNVGGMWRPIRVLGIGATIDIPILQSTKFSFQGSPTDGGSFYDYDGGTYGTSTPTDYTPDIYDYSFKSNPQFNFVVRMFFSGQNTYYADLRMGYLIMDETIQIIRPYKPMITNRFGGVESLPVPEVNIDNTYKHSLLVPGVAMGFNRFVSKRLGLGMKFGLDLLFYNDDPFEVKFAFESTYSGSPNNVTLTSKAEGIKPIYSINLNLNYCF